LFACIAFFVMGINQSNFVLVFHLYYKSIANILGNFLGPPLPEMTSS